MESVYRQRWVQETRAVATAAEGQDQWRPRRSRQQDLVNQPELIYVAYQRPYV